MELYIFSWASCSFFLIFNIAALFICQIPSKNPIDCTSPHTSRLSVILVIYKQNNNSICLPWYNSFLVELRENHIPVKMNPLCEDLPEPPECQSLSLSHDCIMVLLMAVGSNDW